MSSFERQCARYEQMIADANTCEQLIAARMYSNIRAVAEFSRPTAARYRSLMATLQGGGASLNEVQEALNLLESAISKKMEDYYYNYFHWQE